jgi:hypothetical protein
MNAATLTNILSASRDAAYLLMARCNRCSKDVMHGGGTDLDTIANYLGRRSAHCGCGSYEIADPDGVIATRVAEIREQKAARPRRR